MRKRAVVVAIAVRGHATRQAQADVTVALRIAEAKPGDRKHQVGQSEDRRDLVDLVADDADRDRRRGRQTPRTGSWSAARSAASTLALKKPFQRAVADRLAAQSRRYAAGACASPRKTKNTGEAPIHGMAGNSLPIAARCAGSLTRRIDACWKSDLADVLKAGGNEQIKQAVSGNNIAVTAHRLSADDPADKIVVDSPLA